MNIKNTGLITLTAMIAGTLLVGSFMTPASAEVSTANVVLASNTTSNEEEPPTPWVADATNCSVLMDEFALAVDIPIRNPLKLERFELCMDIRYGVVGEDGEITYVFGVTDDEPLTSANTTTDPRTPATLKDIAEICGRVLTWKALRDCILEQDDIQWYIDAINEREEELKFTWDDINTWADDPQLNTPTATQVLIQVYGEGYTLEEIETQAAEIVGPTMAAQLVAENKIAYHPAGFMNTSSVDKEVSDFPDGRTMVRVSLAPVVYNEKGEFLEFLTDSGIFLDCGNLWWIKIMWVCTDSSCEPPVCIPGDLRPECAPKSGDPNVGYWFPEGTVTNLGSGTLTGIITVETTTSSGEGGTTTSSSDAGGSQTGTLADSAGTSGTGPIVVNTNEGAGGNDTDLGGFK